MILFNTNINIERPAAPHIMTCFKRFGMLDRLQVQLFPIASQNEIKYDDDKQALEGMIQVNLSDKEPKKIEESITQILTLNFNSNLLQYVQVLLNHDFSFCQFTFKLLGVRQFKDLIDEVSSLDYLQILLV